MLPNHFFLRNVLHGLNHFRTFFNKKATMTKVNKGGGGNGSSCITTVHPRRPGNDSQDIAHWPPPIPDGYWGTRGTVKALAGI